MIYPYCQMNLSQLNGKTHLIAKYALNHLGCLELESTIGITLHSRYCGKCVCEECSGVLRQLSKTDTKKYRVCDECDETLVSKKVREAFDKLLQRKAEELERKERKIDELKSEKVIEEEALKKLEAEEAEKMKRICAVKTELEEKKATMEECIKMYKTNKVLSAKEIENQKSILQPIDDEVSAKSQQAQSLYDYLLAKIK
jgi:hypothetical protein